MGISSLWRANREGYTFFELLCVMALLSMLGLSLVALQQTIQKSALITVEDNGTEQYLNAVQNRLLLVLPGSYSASITPGNSSSPLRLTVRQELNDGLRQRIYYKALSSSVFYEAAEWITWKGSGTKPGSYVTPIALGITGFTAALQSAEQGQVLRITVTSNSQKREFSIWLRNTR